MAKSRTKKLNDRWGAETSAKGTRFKLNRDLGGYHDTKRDAIEIEAPEAETKIKLPAAAELRVAGDLVHLEHVSLGYKKGQTVVEGVNLTLGYGDRVALVGKVNSLMSLGRASSLRTERQGKVDHRQGDQGVPGTAQRKDDHAFGTEDRIL
jgi:ATPase subunit of ABC transporter with duplicated ATPase domains